MKHKAENNNNKKVGKNCFSFTKEEAGSYKIKLYPHRDTRRELKLFLHSLKEKVREKRGKKEGKVLAYKAEPFLVSSFWQDCLTV